MNQLLKSLLFCSTPRNLNSQNISNNLFNCLTRLDSRLFVDIFDKEEKVQAKAEMLTKQLQKQGQNIKM